LYLKVDTSQVYFAKILPARFQARNSTVKHFQYNIMFDRTGTNKLTEIEQDERYAETGQDRFF
jgi:hypothetical protein